MATKDDYQEFKDALNDLKINSKPVINFLTILAEDKMHNAPLIVRAVEERILEARGEHILPALYVLDSIVKNLRSSVYVQIFENQLPVLFSSAFNKVDERTRSAMFKLRQTWTPFFTNLSLYNLDSRTHDIDPAWPITAKVPDPPPFTPTIHLNPNFLQRNTTLPLNQASTDEMRQEVLRMQKEDSDSSTFRTRTVNQPPIAAAPPKIPEVSSKGDVYRMIPIDRMAQIRQETASVLGTGIDGEPEVKDKKSGGKKKKKRRPSARLRRRVSAILAATNAATNNNQESSSETGTEEEDNPNVDNDDDDDDDEPFVIKTSSAATNGLHVQSTVSAADSTSGGTDHDVEGLFGGTDKDYRDTEVPSSHSTSGNTTTPSLDADSIFEINSKCLLIAEQKYKSNELSSEEYQATLKLLQNMLESAVHRLTVQSTTAPSLLNGNNHQVGGTQPHLMNTNNTAAANNPFQQQLLQFAQQYAVPPQQPLSTFSNPNFPFPSFGDDAHRHVMQILATVGAPPSITSHYNFLPFLPPLPPAPPSFTLLQNQFNSQSPSHPPSSPPQNSYSGRHSPTSKRPHDGDGDNNRFRDEEPKRPRYDPVTGRPHSSHNPDEEKVAPVPTLTDANVNMLKKKYVGIVQQLYIGKFQCRTCGLRFSAKQKGFYNHHLDWHYWENRQEKEMNTQSSSALGQRSRPWYSSVQEWTEYEENIDEQMRTGSLMAQYRQSRQSGYAIGQMNDGSGVSGIVSCPAARDGDIDDDRCYVCRDPFENFFDDNREEWHLRDAIRIDGKIYHPICYQDAKLERTVEKIPVSDAPSMEPLATSTKISMDTIGASSADSSNAAPALTTSEPDDDMDFKEPDTPEASEPPMYISSMSFVDLVETIFVKKEDTKPTETIAIVVKEEFIDTVCQAEDKLPSTTVKFEPESSSDAPIDNLNGVTTEVMPSSD